MSLNRASTHVPVADAGELARREAVRAAARKTVARYSNGDLDACRDLLDMLGLRGEAMCPCGQPMSRPAPDGYARFGADGLCWQCHDQEKRAQAAAAAPSCACGRKILDGSHQCRTCRDFATADEVREVVARLRRLTGRTIRQVAEMAAVNPTALTSACVPSSKVRKVRRDVYDRLLAAEKRWIDLQDYTAGTPLPPIAEFAADGNPTRCQGCGKTLKHRDHPEWGGEVRYGGNGRCETCYQQQRRGATS